MAGGGVEEGEEREMGQWLRGKGRRQWLGPRTEQSHQNCLQLAADCLWVQFGLLLVSERRGVGGHSVAQQEQEKERV